MKLPCSPVIVGIGRGVTLVEVVLETVDEEIEEVVGEEIDEVTGEEVGE